MRALLLVLDGVGCGRASDATMAGETNGHRLGRLLADHPELNLPALFSLGLWKLLTTDVFHPRSRGTVASFGRMHARSAGADSTSGHWEIAGVIVDQPFANLDELPRELLEAIQREARVELLSHRVQGGAAAFDALGPEHVQSAKPIVSVSTDSALQIAAHEKVVSRRRLYEICRVARRHADAQRIGRIVACPFAGEAGGFSATDGRRDFNMTPPRTILNAIAETGVRVEGVGRINALFAGSGVTHATPAGSDAESMAAVESLWADGSDGLVFASLTGFAGVPAGGGDVAGQVEVWRALDRWLAVFLPRWEEDDLIIITGDGRMAPARDETNRLREEAPLMVYHGGLSLALGTRTTFADVAATLAAHFQLRQKWAVGESFITLQQRHKKTYFHRA